MSTTFMTINHPLMSNNSNNNNMNKNMNTSSPINNNIPAQQQQQPEFIQHLLASHHHRQRFQSASLGRPLMGTGAGRISPSGFSLTPLEASIIHALRQKQLEAMATDAIASNTSPLSLTTATTTAAAVANNHSSRASSRTSSPITTTKKQEQKANTTTTTTTTHHHPLALYVQSRRQNSPLSQEEKELLKRPLSPLSHLPPPNKNKSSSSSDNEDDDNEETTINEPGANDVLLGRGGKTNMHSGNRIFRQVVQARQELYRKVPKYDKIWIAQNVVHQIQQAGGRFMRLVDGKWVEVPQKKAIEKASQALREREREHRGPSPLLQKAKNTTTNAAAGPLKKRKNTNEGEAARFL